MRKKKLEVRGIMPLLFNAATMEIKWIWNGIDIGWWRAIMPIYNSFHCQFMCSVRL